MSASGKKLDKLLNYVKRHYKPSNPDSPFQDGNWYISSRYVYYNMTLPPGKVAAFKATLPLEVAELMTVGNPYSVGNQSSILFPTPELFDLLFPAEKEDFPQQLVGMGGYSCVYSPPIPCPGKAVAPEYASTDYVSKLTSRFEELEKEFRIKERLDEAKVETKDYQPYLILPLENYCEIDPGLHLKRSCPMLKKRVFKVIEVNGGVILSESKNLTDIKWIWEQFQHLLRGLDLLHKVGVFHNDVKGSNILVDKHQQTRLIDFGIALLSPVQATLKDVGIFDSEYPYWPLFATVLQLLERDTRRQAIEWLHATYDRAAVQHSGSREKEEGWRDGDVRKVGEGERKKETWEKQREAGEDTVSVMIKRFESTRPVERYLQEVLLPNLHKVDAFSLAFTFNLTLNKNLIPDSPHKDALYFMFAQLTNPDFAKQWDIHQALDFMQQQHF